jgi:hypothetical protein
MKLFFSCLFLVHFVIQYAQNISPYHQLHDLYLEKQITTRKFTHDQLMQVLEKHSHFERRELGKSIENRSIHLFTLGNGPKKVLLWSQMHGNESTATLALLDLLNFFSGKERLAQSVLNELTIYIIPMLNPDGAEYFRRHNAAGIDLNRDALRLAMPESKILKRIRDELEPDWGFNLHDQNRYYSAGVNTGKTASISFLAPPFDYEKTINEKRGEAMKMIALLNNKLQSIIPGKIGRYQDDFEPRAFGDNIQKWGTRTILVETGAHKDDIEKQYLRKLNFVLLMEAFEHIAHGSFDSLSIEDYFSIPFNESNAFLDLIVRNVQYKMNNHPFTLDLGFRRNDTEINSGYIHDVGDLSIFFGYDELDGSGYELVKGKVYPEKINDVSGLLRLNPIKLLQDGYTQIQVTFKPLSPIPDRFPFKLINQITNDDYPIFPGKNPSCLLIKNQNPEWVLWNGYLISIKDQDAIAQVWHNYILNLQKK